LLFRDYLRLHADMAKEYAQIKMQLAQKFPRDRNSYLNGKASFIQRVLQTAIELS